LIAALISSYLADFSSLTVRSTTETSTVGTRKAIPVSLPFRAGSTFPTAWNEKKRIIHVKTNESKAFQRNYTTNLHRTPNGSYLCSSSAARNDVEWSSSSTSPVLWRGSINSFLGSWVKIRKGIVSTMYPLPLPTRWFYFFLKKPYQW